jgi:hypothetical protein
MNDGYSTGYGRGWLSGNVMGITQQYDALGNYAMYNPQPFNPLKSYQQMRQDLGVEEEMVDEPVKNKLLLLV